MKMRDPTNVTITSIPAVRGFKTQPIWRGVDPNSSQVKLWNACAAGSRSAVTSAPQARRNEAAIAAIAAGQLVIVADDEDRENEGDLIGAAEFITAEKVNFFMGAKGMICLALSPEKVQQLDQIGRASCRERV